MTSHRALQRATRRAIQRLAPKKKPPEPTPSWPPASYVSPNSLLARVLTALDVTPEVLAIHTAHTTEEILELAMPPGKQGPIDLDVVWHDVFNYVNTRTGLILAAREELQRQLARENRRRISERLSVEQR